MKFYFGNGNTAKKIVKILENIRINKKFFAKKIGHMKKRIIIIAEIGCNHNGKFNQAVKLIKRAKRAGADYAKFQLFNSDEVITKNAKSKLCHKKLKKKSITI